MRKSIKLIAEFWILINFIFYISGKVGFETFVVSSILMIALMVLNNKSDD
jgi:hypothetical protein